MKQLLALVLLLLGTIPYSVAQKGLVGAWEVTEIDGHLETGLRLVFHKDGVLDIIARMGTEKTSWRYTDGTKKTIKIEDGIDGKKNLSIEELSKTTLVLKPADDGPAKFTRVKMPKKANAISPKKLEKIIIGEWVPDFKSREEIEDDLTFIIRGDGTMEEIENGRSRKGSWRLDKDAEHILLTAADSKNEDKLGLELIDKNTLRFIEHGAGFTFTRKGTASKGKGTASKSSTKKVSTKKAKKLLVGTWYPMKKDFNLTFNSDGTFEANERGRVKQGHWDLNADGTKIQFSLEKDPEDEESMGLKIVDKNMIKLGIKGDFVTFVKTGPKKDSPGIIGTDPYNPDNPPKEEKIGNEKVFGELVGEWQITRIALEELPKGEAEINLTKDRKAITFISGEKDKDAKWNVNEAGNQLIIIDSYYSKSYLTIKSIEANKITLEDNGDEMILERKQ